MKKTIMLTMFLMLICSVQALAMGVEITEDNFPDEQFRALIAGFDTDGDLFLTEEECNAITEIHCNHNTDIKSVEGIQYFPNLEHLNVEYIFLDSLDVSSNPKLTSLNCEYSCISALDLSSNTLLKDLWVSNTRYLNIINLSYCPFLLKAAKNGIINDGDHDGYYAFKDEDTESYLRVDRGSGFVFENDTTVFASELKHGYSEDEEEEESVSSGQGGSSAGTGNNTTPDPSAQATADRGIGSIASPAENGKYNIGSDILLDIRPTGSAGLGNIRITGTCQVLLGNTVKFSEMISTTGTSGAVTSKFTPDAVGTYTMVVDLKYTLSGLTVDTSHHSVTFQVINPNAGVSGKKNGGSQNQKTQDEREIKTGSASYTVTENLKEITFKAPADKSAKKITIPAVVRVNGKSVPVTSIAPGAFKGMKKLTSVTIGKNVKKIGKNAFNGCKKLKKITIKTTKLTKKSVGANAFKGISKKAVVKCPKSKKKAYKKFLLKKGLKKTMTFK